MSCNWDRVNKRSLTDKIQNAETQDRFDGDYLFISSLMRYTIY